MTNQIVNNLGPHAFSHLGCDASLYAAMPEFNFAKHNNGIYGLIDT
ncbi:hypothetical protein [Candidatus Marimicrobium litorale]|nr:hypothetical protein [Candidatus Marimicrobium litorale]